MTLEVGGAVEGSRDAVDNSERAVDGSEDAAWAVEGCSGLWKSCR